MSIKPTASTIHERKTFARVDEEDMKRVLAEAVATVSGIDLAAEGTSARVVITSRTTGIGVEKYAEVTIIEKIGSTA